MRMPWESSGCMYVAVSVGLTGHTISIRGKPGSIEYEEHEMPLANPGRICGILPAASACPGAARRVGRIIAFVLLGLLMPPLASAQTGAANAAAADLQSQAQECARLARDGDLTAASACQKKLMSAVQAAMPAPEDMRRMQQDIQEQHKAADENTRHATQDAQQAADAGHQRALDCTTLKSSSGKAGGSGYGYSFSSACDQPVTVHLCVADGPQEPSRKRKARLQPGESVRWTFAKRGGYSPMAIHDACFEPDQCAPPPGPVACREP